MPTAAEAGVPGFEVSSWQAIFAPAGTPKPIVQRLNTEIAQRSEAARRPGPAGQSSP